jgi:nucleoid DNA-binding protein
MNNEHEQLNPEGVGPEFDRTDMALAIAERTQINPYTVTEVLKGLASVLPDALVQFGGRVEIKGLGVFRLEERNPRKGITPQKKAFKTGKRQEIVYHAAPEINHTVTQRTEIETYSA